MTAMRARGLAVRKVANNAGESLRISERSRQVFAVTLDRGSRVAELSKELGAGSPLAAALGRCNARLVVSALPGTAVGRKEQAMLTTLHAALMEETQEIVYTIRDRQLSGPK